MPIPLRDIEPGCYIARKKEQPGTEFICVVWGVFPFLQCYSVPADSSLSDRPNFDDVRILEHEFLVRLPGPADLAAALIPEE